MKITLVKKILADGQPCGKCADVQNKLDQNNYMRYIDETLIADERDPVSPGMLLAQQLGVERAPFFIVENADKTTVYTVYFKFVREVLNKQTSQSEDATEILRDNPDLDYL